MKKIFSLLLILIMILGMSISSYATDNSFSITDVINADEGNVEGLGQLMLDNFYSNPDDFFTSVKGLSEEEQDRAISILVVSSFINEDVEKFKLYIDKIKNDYDSKLIKSMENEITRIEKNNEIKEIKEDKDFKEKELFRINSKIVEKMIENNNGTLDEEFIEIISKHFQNAPILMSKIISKYDDSMIDKLCNFIAYDITNKEIDINKIKENKDNSKLSTTEKEDKVSNLIFEKVNNQDFDNILQKKQGRDDSISNNVEKFNLPTISNISTKDEIIETNKKSTVQVSLTEVSQIDIDRTYTVEMYRILDNKKYLKDRKVVSMSLGDTNLDVNFDVTFYQPEKNMELMVSVYSDTDTNSEAVIQKTMSLLSTSKWAINVELPENRNYKGDLYLWNTYGDLVFNCECLGRSASNDSMYVYYGNTPTGVYTGYLYGPMSNTYSYGPYKVINMTGQAGVIIESGRSGIWIHGGDPSTDPSKTYYPLRPTYGCVRISNNNQFYLQNAIQAMVGIGYSATGNIGINEY